MMMMMLIGLQAPFHVELTAVDAITCVVVSVCSFELNMQL